MGFEVKVSVATKTPQARLLEFSVDSPGLVPDLSPTSLSGDIFHKEMTIPLIIIGGSGHAAVVAEAAEKAGHGILGFVADTPSSLGLLGTEDALPALLQENPKAQFFVAIGDNHVRRVVSARLRAAFPGVPFAVIIHPSAVIARRSHVERGAFVGAGAIVAVDAEVGEGAILNTRASLDHHAEIGDFASMAPASATGGRVKIGPGSAIGMGAMIHHNVSIGADSVLGSLSLANKDLPDCVTAIGNPARVVSSRKPGDKYL